MTMTVLTIVLRMLKHTEGLLYEMRGPLAESAYLDVHNARMSIETLARVEHNSLANHVTGQR